MLSAKNEAESVSCDSCIAIASGLKPGFRQSCPACGAELCDAELICAQQPRERSFGQRLDRLLYCAGQIAWWRLRVGPQALDLAPESRGVSDRDPDGLRSVEHQRRIDRGRRYDRLLATVSPREARDTIEWLVQHGGPGATAALALKGRRMGVSGYAEALGRATHPTRSKDSAWWGTPTGRLNAGARGTRLLEAAVAAWEKVETRAESDVDREKHLGHTGLAANG